MQVYNDTYNNFTLCKEQSAIFKCNYYECNIMQDDCVQMYVVVSLLSIQAGLGIVRFKPSRELTVT